jgi:hypothetical protein
MIILLLAIQGAPILDDMFLLLHFMKYCYVYFLTFFKSFHLSFFSLI